MNDLEFTKDIYIRFTHAVNTSVTSEEVSSSVYLQTAAADLAGGDAESWTRFVKQHRIDVLQREVQHHFQNVRDLEYINRFIVEHTSDAFVRFMTNSLKSISE